jgi:hypothetical protein
VTKASAEVWCRQKFGPARQETGRKFPRRCCVLARYPQLLTTNNKDSIIMMDQLPKKYTNDVVEAAQKMPAAVSKTFALLSILEF